MLKEGAQLIVDAEQAVEIVCDLIGEQRFAFGEPKRSPHERRVAKLSPELRAVYDAITEDSTLDEIAGTARIDPADAAAALSLLELDGLVDGDGGRWRRLT